MSHLKKTALFLAPIAAALWTGVFVATTVAIAAPKPDADVPPPPKPVKIKIKPAPGRTVVNITKAKPKPAFPTGLKGVVIDEPNMVDGTVNIVTENDEFATVAANMGTRVRRGYQLASLSDLHPGYTVRCQGNWDRDGYQYQANDISIGTSINEIALVNRVGAACARVRTSRKSGGFGQALVAMVPPTGLPKAMSIGGKTAPKEIPPLEGTANTSGTPAPAPGTPAPTKPTTPTTTPVDPSLIKPVIPIPTTPSPGTLPQAPQAPPAPAYPTTPAN